MISSFKLGLLQVGARLFTNNNEVKLCHNSYAFYPVSNNSFTMVLIKTGTPKLEKKN